MIGFTWLAALALAKSGQNPTTPVPVQSPTPAIPAQVPAVPASPLPSVAPSPSAPTVVGAPGGVASGVGATGAPIAPAPVAPTPVVINASLNQDFTLGSLQYRVVRVTPGLASYILQHDQRGARLTPGYRNDRLVVVEVEVTNSSSFPASFTGITPSLVDSGGAMTNRTQWDVRQQSYVRSTDDMNGAALRFSTYLAPEDTGPYGDTSDAVMIAPGGHVNFALVFSEPAATHPGSVRFDASQGYSNPAAAVGVVTLQ